MLNMIMDQKKLIEELAAGFVQIKIEAETAIQSANPLAMLNTLKNQAKQADHYIKRAQG